MSWYLYADGNLYKAEKRIHAPGWSLDENTPHDQPIHGWTWYDTDDDAMLATGLTVSITARLDRIDPPLTPDVKATRATLDQKVRNAVTKGGTLDVSLGTTDDVAPARTNAAIKVASLRSLNKLSNADTAAQAGPVLQRLIALMIDETLVDKRVGKLVVQMYDEA